jgi:succinyl-CoA synthetase beta subunit
VEAVLAKIQRVEIVDDFSPFYARKLAHQMGLEGAILQEVSRVVEKMYQLFAEKDLDLIEINPLGVNADGEVMALDGKITVNDYGLGRHPDVIAFAERQPQSEPTSAITWVDADAPVGLISNDVNLALATWDLLAQKKIALGGYGVVPDQVTEELLHPPLAEIEQVLTQFFQSNVEVVLINSLASAAGTEQVAQGIAAYLQRQVENLDASKGEERMERPTSATARGRRQKSRYARSQRQNTPKSFPHLVVRLVEDATETLTQETENLPVDWISNLDSAIATVKSLVKTTTKKS